MELDKDLAARQEVRTLASAARKAQHILADMSQEQLDAIVEAMARAFAAEAGMLAEMAVQETGFGKVEDKVTTNLFASREVAKAVLNLSNAKRRAGTVIAAISAITGLRSLPTITRARNAVRRFS